MTTTYQPPTAGPAPRRQSSAWPRAVVASLVLHAGFVAWAAQSQFAILVRWSVQAGVHSAPAIEARFSEGDLNAERIERPHEEQVLQIKKSTARTSPEDRLLTGGAAPLNVAKQTVDAPTPESLVEVGELSASAAPPVETPRRDRHPSPTVEPRELIAAVPRAKRAHEVQVEPIEPTVASAESTASLASQGAESPTPPQAVANPAPPYPPEALAQGLTGRVAIRVRLTDDGHVAEASLYRSCGKAILDDAALAAVRNWRFEPPQGRMLREFSVPVNFVIAGR